MSAEQMAGFLNLHPSSYSRLERNETYVDFNSLVIYAEKLNIPVHEFLPELTSFSGNSNTSSVAGASIVFGDFVYNASNESIVKELELRNAFLTEKVEFLENQLRLSNLIIEKNFLK